MNERIKELAKQADEGYTGDSRDDMGTSLVGNDAIEKFAELIVQEYIKLNGKELAMAGHSRMIDVYCEHFGIEL
jgi:hypothetical protein